MLQLIKLLIDKRNRFLAPFHQYVYKMTDNGIRLETETITLTIPTDKCRLLSNRLIDTSVTLGTGIDIPQPEINLTIEPIHGALMINEAVFTSEDVYERRITELEDTVQELMDQIEMLTRNGNNNGNNNET